MAENQEDPTALRDRETVRLLKNRRPDGLHQVLTNYGPKVRWYLRKEFRGTLNEPEIDEAINLAAHRAHKQLYPLGILLQH